MMKFKGQCSICVLNLSKMEEKPLWCAQFQLDMLFECNQAYQLVTH
jgi:hypothetical protein